MMSESSRIYAVVIAASLMMHLSVAGLIVSVDQAPPVKYEKVRISVVPVEPALPVPVEPVPPPPKPKPSVEKPKSERETKVAKANAAPVQGLSATALSEGAGGISVPIGNTLMVEDKGIRLKAEQVDPLAKDLSVDARLIASTLEKPVYTDEAIDAGVEGVFTVDVFVDENGAVRDASLESRIGFGMDQRVTASIKKAKFSPRRDKQGRAIPGWTRVRFSLVME